MSSNRDVPELEYIDLGDKQVPLRDSAGRTEDRAVIGYVQLAGRRLFGVAKDDRFVKPTFWVFGAGSEILAQNRTNGSFRAVGPNFPVEVVGNFSPENSQWWACLDQEGEVEPTAAQPYPIQDHGGSALGAARVSVVRVLNNPNSPLARDLSSRKVPTVEMNGKSYRGHALPGSALLGVVQSIRYNSEKDGYPAPEVNPDLSKYPRVIST